MYVLWHFVCYYHIVALLLGFDGRITVFSPNDEEHELSLTLSDVLVFGTGAACEPPMGLYPKPKISFKDGSCYLTANTCTNTIYLPTKEMSYGDFNYYAIANYAGFGQI